MRNDDPKAKTTPMEAAKAIYSQQGVLSLLVRLAGYMWSDHLRSLFPKRGQLAKYNGVLVEVEAARVTDKLIGVTNYEGALCWAIRRFVDSNDRVVIVGGGRGVSAVVASQETGVVTVFEASPDQVDSIRRTLELNGCEATVVSKRVTTDGRVWGEHEVLEAISPADLPECDVLVLDCEGAERPILAELETQPTMIIVEYHGHYDASRETVSKLLESQGYEIIHHEPMISENEIGVMVGSLLES